MKIRLFQQAAIALAAILCLAAYCHGLFVDLTGDAGKYAAIARHIVESNDWIDLKIHGEPYDQKPPLHFWLAAAGFALGGLHNWSYKLFPVAYGLAGIYFAYRLGKELYGKRAGQLAAVMLLGCESFVLLAMDVHTDFVLQTNVTLAIWQLAAYSRTRKTPNFVLAFVAVGLAMMSKGPIGAAVPAFALGTQLLTKGRFREIASPKWLAGGAIALAVASPAFIGLYRQFGAEGITFFFITNNLGRITGQYAGSNSDPFFYVHSLLYLFAPWTPILLYALFREGKEMVREAKSKADYFAMGAIIPYFIILSVAKGKAPHYLLILIPLFAVLTGKWLAKTLEQNNTRQLNRIQHAQNLFLLAVGAIYLMLVAWIFPAPGIAGWIIFGLSTSAAAAVAMRGESFAYRLVLPGLLLMGGLSTYVNAEALPRAFAYQASTRASRLFNRQAAPTDTIYNYRYPQYEIFFYSRGKSLQLNSTEHLPARIDQAWVFTDETGKDSLLHAPGIKTIQLEALKNRGMNRAGIGFINPATREQSLETCYLIQISRPGIPMPD